MHALVYFPGNQGINEVTFLNFENNIPRSFEDYNVGYSQYYMQYRN